VIKDILYLGSQSRSRQKLLQEVGIPFVVVPHSSKEAVVRGNLPFERYVIAIAQEKMKTLLLPQPTKVDKNYLFALTADTLVHLTSSGNILGKPKDREDAKAMMRSMHNKEVEVITGCCLHRYAVHQEQWQVDQESTWATGAVIEFWVDEEFLDIFYEREPIALMAAGATIIEGYGQLFFKRITGSHSTVIGLPLFELRQKLKKMGFRF
jgi:septum formation protein